MIQCDDAPIKITRALVEYTVVPKFNAPLICKACRLNPVKFRAARKAMFQFFGWIDEKAPKGVPLKEL